MKTAPFKCEEGEQQGAVESMSIFTRFDFSLLSPKRAMHSKYLMVNKDNIIEEPSSKVVFRYFST